jgi:hypothetical protein
MVKPPLLSEADMQRGWYRTPAYSVVFTSDFSHGAAIAAIYFALQDRNFDSVQGSLPLWRLAVDESSILAGLQCIHMRWTPLPPIHPDPTVDPGVPIERRPQDDPRWTWYRQECQHYDIFKGKVSGSRLFRFIGGGYEIDAFIKESNFKGNSLTRFGKATECKIVLAHLLRFTAYTMSECGTYAHPTIPDACGTPDAILLDPKRTIDTVPSWVKDLWVKEGPGHERIDWRHGVFEAKSMMYLDKHRRGPEIKPEYICQIYWAMICSGTYWGECARCCDESRQGRVFRIYRCRCPPYIPLPVFSSCPCTLSDPLSDMWVWKTTGAQTRPGDSKPVWLACARR